MSPARVAQVEAWVSHAMGGRPLGQEAKARLETTLRILHASGVPEGDVSNWVQKKRSHDFWATVCTGALSQTGYLAGMVSALRGWTFPARMLAQSSQFGAVVGLSVGVLDTTTNVAAGLLQARLLNAGPSSSVTPGIARHGQAGALVRDAAWAVTFNVAKNIWRTVLPFVQARIEGRADGSIDRNWSDLTDVLWDGAMGLLPGAINACRQLHEGGDGVPYLARLLLQPPEAMARLAGVNLALPVGQVAPQEGDGAQQDAGRPQAARSPLRNAVSTAVVAASIIGVIGVHISMLLARNTSILEDGHRESGLPEGRVDPRVMSVKALSSTHQMALMTATIHLLMPVFEMAADYLIDPKLPRGIGYPSFLKPGLNLQQQDPA